MGEAKARGHDRRAGFRADRRKRSWPDIHVSRWDRTSMFFLAFLVSGPSALGRRTFSRAFWDNIVFGDRRHRPVDVRQAVDGEAVVALIGDGDVSLAALFVGITCDRIGRAEITGRVGLPRNDRADFDLLLQRL